MAEGVHARVGKLIASAPNAAGVASHQGRLRAVFTCRLLEFAGIESEMAAWFGLTEGARPTTPKMTTGRQKETLIHTLENGAQSKLVTHMLTLVKWP